MEKLHFHIELAMTYITPCLTGNRTQNLSTTLQQNGCDHPEGMARILRP